LSDSTSSQGHYVYRYLDSRGRVRYVGYGRETDRATSHLVGSHNRALNEFLEAKQYRIEIAGPFADEQTGRAVETALISALQPEFNIDAGPSRWRFRPLGVPLQYADRLSEPELLLHDFLSAQGSDPVPVLFVIVTSVDFDDDRVGYNPASPPSDEQIRVRVDRWWQVRRFVDAWASTPDDSPGLLIGVFGSPGRQMVIASARVDRANWREAETVSGGLVRVPLVEPVDLDAFSLRGRRIASAAGLRFGGYPAQFFVRLGRDGAILESGAS